MSVFLIKPQTDAGKQQAAANHALKAVNHPDMVKVVWANINHATGKHYYGFNYQKPGIYRTGQVIVGAFSGCTDSQCTGYTCEVIQIID